MEKELYPSQPVRVLIVGPSGVGKTHLLKHLLLNINNNFDKIYFYTPSIEQEIYQKLIECFDCCIPINYINSIIDGITSIDDVKQEIDPPEGALSKGVERSKEVECYAYNSIDELLFPNEFSPAGRSPAGEASRRGHRGGRSRGASGCPRAGSNSIR